MKGIILAAILVLCGFNLARAVDYKNFVSDAPPHEPLDQYLSETIEISGSLAHNRLTDKEACDQALNLQNRLDNIYSVWHLQFRSKLQGSLLGNLNKTLRAPSNAYVRMESAICLGIVGDTSSIPFLKQATHDPDELVRKYAEQSMDVICNN